MLWLGLAERRCISTRCTRCSTPVSSNHSLLIASLSILHESFFPPSGSCSVSNLGTLSSKSSALTLKSESHLWRPFPPFGQNLTSAKMISRCSFKISNVQIQNIQCSPFVDTVTAGHWGGAGRRPWETENLLRARQLVPHLTHNVLPLFLLAARAAWESLTAWYWRPSRKIAPPLWRLELQSPPSR